ncbi:helix-turn-helix transcriptional regulator [Clostridioides mangenotii]|uniref:helix-turn-helix domain-containing protein n=1 Tax=Metaclostridioides mangenotii TaxID=1540 RepID=UPI001C1119D9|nr:helix-turn-helix transcriptional regulator [Clostridioides mangenotii]MBU5308424.1 helix-turn-helix transcriptional regulator [Clostridioides mangenotii]
MTIGDKINQLLFDKNMKAYILAEKIETDPSNLYRIIRNENTNPTIKIVKKIADAFEVSVDELVCDIDAYEKIRK